jgi:hypothetical protein
LSRWTDTYLRLVATGRKRPILLKKSAMVCASEKYASEIEIFTFGRGFPGADFTQQRAKKAFSLVNDQAVLDDRLFQQNRPIADIRRWMLLANSRD